MSQDNQKENRCICMAGPICPLKSQHTWDWEQAMNYRNTHSYKNEPSPNKKEK